MAKSQRASSIKRNNANLRSKIFAPHGDARTARLSAKLQELAASSKPPDTTGTTKREQRALAGMDVDDHPESKKGEGLNGGNGEAEMDVDVDAEGQVNVKRKSTRKSKKSNLSAVSRGGKITKAKKPRNNIIFPDLAARKKRQMEARARRKH